MSIKTQYRNTVCVSLFTAKKLAELLGLPFFEISLSKITPKELTAKADGAIKDGQLAPCGLIAESFAGCQCTNAIFFIDEVSDVMHKGNKDSGAFQMVLKELLDPDRSEIMDLSFGVPIKIANAVFIIAGNFAPEDHGGALLDRIDTYRFLAPNEQTRAGTAVREFQVAQSHYGVNDEVSATEPDIVFDEISQTYQKQCRDHGLRPLKRVLNQYILYRQAIAAGVVFSQGFDVQQAFKDALGKGLKTLDKE